MTSRIRWIASSLLVLMWTACSSTPEARDDFAALDRALAGTPDATTERIAARYLAELTADERAAFEAIDWSRITAAELLANPAALHALRIASEEAPSAGMEALSEADPGVGATRESLIESCDGLESAVDAAIDGIEQRLAEGAVATVTLGALGCPPCAAAVALVTVAVTLRSTVSTWVEAMDAAECCAAWGSPMCAMRR